MSAHNVLQVISRHFTSNKGQGILTLYSKDPNITHSVTYRQCNGPWLPTCFFRFIVSGVNNILMLLSNVHVRVPSSQRRVEDHKHVMLTSGLLRKFLPLSGGLLSHLLTTVSRGSILRVLLFRMDRVRGYRSPNMR